MKLYEIPIEAAQIEILLTESEGELTPEIEARISEFLAGGEQKLENAACVVKSLDAQAEACKVESKRLAARQHALENNCDRLKALMLMAVDAAFKGKLKTPLFTIWGQTSAGSATFALAQGKELRDLPDAFVKFEAPTLDTGALWQAWRNHQELPSDVVVTELEGKRSLRIR
jgi:hypothetical protein